MNNLVVMLLENDNSETTAIYKPVQIKNIVNSHELSSRRMNSVPVKSTLINPLLLSGNTYLQSVK